MRLVIYNFLVNRHSGIRSRYHRVHDNAGFLRRIFSWFYLLWLNFCYYCLFLWFLGEPEKAAIYEEKNLLLKTSESAERCKIGPTVEEAVDYLSGYDIISFDIFDTLIFRPFSEPADLFYFLSEKAGILDIKRIRMEQEAAARQECYKQNKHYEVTLAGIWKRMEREVGINADYGMEAEQELELQFCYANPFMFQVFCKLQELGKKMIVVSDMYLSGAFLQKLLKKNGYTGMDRLYVSCEAGCGKYNGKLFAKVKEDFGEAPNIVHVGDNLHSDVKMAKKAGFDTFYYPNVNKMAQLYRSYDMSPVVGGAYRGIVDNHLYTGLQAYSMEYEYGYIYGGLFAVGYCNYIHNYCREHHVDKLLFLARDGDTLKQVYDRMFPGEDTHYVRWSRAAATKLMALHNKEDYFRRYLYHKVNKKRSIHQILCSMELETLEEKLADYEDRDITGVKTGIILNPVSELTNGNVETLKRFLQEHFAEIAALYEKQNEAAKRYYEQVLAGAKHAAAVDIGWAGSGAISLAFLVERVWKLPCKITGIVAGTNTIHNAEPDASEAFLQSEKLVSYLFSQSHNREVMKKHDLNKDYNVYWELLLSSVDRQFVGFDLDEQGKVKLRFGKQDINEQGIREIQRGILDFAEIYLTHFRGFPQMLAISGRDAYAPMLLAASYKEKYLKTIAKRFSIEIGVE